VAKTATPKTKLRQGRARAVSPKASGRAPGERASGWRRYATLVAVTLLLATGSWAYSDSFAGVFVFDDIGSITSNPHIKSWWPLTTSMSASKDVTVAGRPVAALTLALNYALAPEDARDALTPPGPTSPPDDAERFLRNVWGYHALNLVVHLLAGLTLFGVVRRSLRSSALRESFGRSSTRLAWLVALIWLVHPLNTESVTYVVQRVESLMGLFYLVTLYCAIRAVEPGWLQRWWIGGSIAACTLGMGCKESMVTAPVMVVLWDLLIGQGDVGGRAEVWHKRRLFLYAGLAATWAVLAGLVATDPRSNSVGFGLGGWTWWSYLQTQAGVVVHYLRLSIVPTPLVFDYEWPRATSFGDVAPQALLLVALLAGTIVAVIRRHPIGFAGAWFFLILAPTSSILPIPTEVAAEHRMYLPVAAIVALAIVGLHGLGRRPLFRRGRGGSPSEGPVGPIAAVVGGVVVAAMFGTMTSIRNRVYWTDEGLMRDTVEKRPLNIRARVAYGADLLAAQRFAEAEGELAVAARLEGSDKAHAQANMYFGSALCAQGKTAEGIAHLSQALSLDSTLAEAHALLGEAYASQGALRLAATHFTLAVEGLPDNAAVLRRAAWQLATSLDGGIRDGGRAVELAERAVRLTARRDVMALEALMAAYAEQDRFGEAAAAGREALALARARTSGLLVGPLEREIALCEAGRKLREDH
jgi:tetratricopeptide (TPR) repeat protein